MHGFTCPGRPAKPLRAADHRRRCGMRLQLQLNFPAIFKTNERTHQFCQHGQIVAAGQKTQVILQRERADN